MSRTRLLMTILVISVAIYDLIVVSLGGVEISVSSWFESFGSYPAIVFGIGFVCGHWFGYFRKGMPAGARVELLKIAKEIRNVHSAYLVIKDWPDRLERIAGE